MKKTIVKIILGITIFLGVIICSQNVSKASNLELFTGKYNKTIEIKSENNTDITNIIKSESENATSTNKILIHIF